MFPYIVLQLSSELDAAANALLAVLFIVLVYLVLTRVVPKSVRNYSREKEPRERGREVPRQFSKLEQVREAAHAEQKSLEDELRHLKQVKMELRKNYMKGEIDADTFKHLDRENEHKLVDAQARLHALQQVSKSPSGNEQV